MINKKEWRGWKFILWLLCFFCIWSTYTFGQIMYLESITERVLTLHPVRCEVYHATAPFGYLYKNPNGRGSIFGFHMNTDLTEVIIIKYLDPDNRLKTIKSTDIFVDIEIVVDGSFYLDIVYTYREVFVNGELKSGKIMYDWGKYYVLHIPSLPTPLYNETRDYIELLDGNP